MGAADLTPRGACPQYGRLRRLRLRELNEAEAYARCYAARDDTVKVVRAEPRRPRYATRVSGEQLRRLFEERLERREPLSKP